MNNYTLLSKTLQEDPSCQLCFIMQKLVLDEGVDRVENIFKQAAIPNLNTLRQVKFIIFTLYIDFNFYNIIQYAFSGHYCVESSMEELTV